MAAGLLIALAGMTRTAAVPLLGLAALYLLLRRTPWRRTTALLLAGALPLLAYAGWYAQHHGRFALSGSDGVALWARTMTFADCRIIQPPPKKAKLCPNGTTVDAASEYVWAPGASLNQLPGDRFLHNDLARSFALKAIAAQPLDYLREVVAGHLPRLHLGAGAAPPAGDAHHELPVRLLGAAGGARPDTQGARGVRPGHPRHELRRAVRV